MPPLDWALHLNLFEAALCLSTEQSGGIAMFPGSSIAKVATATGGLRWRATVFMPPLERALHQNSVKAALRLSTEQSEGTATFQGSVVVKAAIATIGLM